MSPRRWWMAFGLLTACVGIFLLVRHVSRPATPVAVLPAAGHPAPSLKVAHGDLDQVLAVMARGGTALELAQAIETLDIITRRGQALPESSHAALLAAMEHGAPDPMDEGAWAHLFNCGCNALAVGQSTPDESLIALLERTAAEDSRLVMRLYALQHLGVRYDTATPACQERLRTLVRGMLDDTDAQTAGTALVLWRRWEKPSADGDDASFEMSRAMAADASRPVDVRITALHAIGEEPRVLELARSIATDTSQAVILRKAALNLIGRHGGTDDLSLLRRCAQESPRLSQAAQPAVKALEDRRSGKPTAPLTRIPWSGFRTWVTQ